jgi:hypothetical protein
LRRGQRHTVAQSGIEGQAERWRRAGRHERHPDVAARSRRELEARGHDADDRVRLFVERQRGADHIVAS